MSLQDFLNLLYTNPISAVFISAIYSFWHPDWHRMLLAYKISAGIISFLLLLALSYFLGRSSYVKAAFWQDIVEILTFRQYGQRKIVKQWQYLLKRMERASEAEQKLLVIEAEGVLDNVFIRMGLIGATFGERLKSISPAQLPSLAELKKAHDIRNNIVHDPDYRLSSSQAREVIIAYEKALKELDAF